jgi:hypothetical protein
VVAFALIGIVAMQLLVLKLNTSIGRTLEREALLQRDNAQLGIENSKYTAEGRVASLAGAAGMTVALVGTIHFVAAGATDVARASTLLSNPLQTPLGVSESTETTGAPAPQGASTGGAASGESRTGEAGSAGSGSGEAASAGSAGSGEAGSAGSGEAGSGGSGEAGSAGSGEAVSKARAGERTGEASRGEASSGEAGSGEAASAVAAQADGAAAAPPTATSGGGAQTGARE